VETPDEPFTVKFKQAGEWWTATVKTSDGTIVGTGPTRELARDDLDWLLLHRSQTRESAK
jgi:hypothetical protein